jgi:RNA-directed DNA polymerase
MIKDGNNTSQSWKDLPWKKFQRKLFNLQKRVFKATAARMMAIRQVTQS